MDKTDLEQKQNRERRISTEVVQSHFLLKWLIGIAGANLGVFLIGGVSIWVNDANQDTKLIKQGEAIELRQTKTEAALTKELLEAKIAINSKGNDEVKQILFSIQDDIKTFIRDTKSSKE